MPTLLVVDDEPSILYFFRQAFAEPEVTLLTAPSAAEGVEAVTRDVAAEIEAYSRGRAAVGAGVGS